MLEDLQSAREQWGGVNDTIDRWLRERQLLLVDYCSLSDEPDGDQAAAKLQRTCQLLVDYISAGHFEIYDKLIKEGKDFANDKALAEAKGLFADIDNTTEHILDFNDKYQETDDLSSLAQDLSQLGETLATRFEAEDRMIEVLHNAHKDRLH
ncbi:sigma D regulator [Pseudomaricurvus alcaniphilus]|uniref:sigma D regulator n=1 Tax=Pseudomaricurvus alcaniphilus TaxID=1166482 RepID=UPI0014096A55|nr:sigma D regulator [Pseudomaricurvus alcaniphilus]NHN38758.1 sigma D regulator [Pseudomaricurvus alcaniphilus]